MKRAIIYIIGIIVSVSFLASCATYSNGRGNKGIPPGKAKKIFGTKSAKPFAPGQQKKKKNKGKKQKKNNKKRYSSYYLPIWQY